jgi:hypothetical protein
VIHDALPGIDRSADFRRNRVRAEDLVAAGRGRELFEMDFMIGPTLRTLS